MSLLSDLFGELDGVLTGFHKFLLLHLLGLCQLTAGIIISISIPALYDKFNDQVDRCAEVIHHRFSKHYKIVDESLQSRLPKTLSKDKDP